MSIYTKTGDKGETFVYGGKKVAKSDLQVEAYGSIDELTSFIGFVNSQIKNKKYKSLLLEIQKDLYQIMSFLANAPVNLNFLEKRTRDFEKMIDEIEKNLKPLKNFIIPGGTKTSSLFHILRVFCRKGERNVVRFFNNNQKIKNIKITAYLNRLSDLFFIIARFYNKNKEIIL